ncbi:MAG TPA: hypothetical protein PKC30_06200 [Saprospiraceae bacterium]|nr:hypothetical protein [Saprospiraceae bacterium]
MNRFILFLIIGILSSTVLEAQYFGRNKPRYRSFDFKVKETEHYQIYHYFKNQEVVEHLGQLSELWYDFHKAVLQEDLVKKNPMIFYANHAEFQMTNTISGGIGVGTGGVTEAFKNRVIMPVTFTNQQTKQVLGHEIVHAFQFNSILNSDSTNLQSLANLPLWLVEGMAEYMSIGRVDPYTAMWMRDAILNDDIPNVRRLAHPRYFPYRYGQAMISFLAGLYGDGVIKPLFRNTALFGVQYTIENMLGMSMENLSEIWESGLRNHYKPWLEGKVEMPQGRKLLSAENSGRINVSPAMSPNGRYVIFLSERDLFSTDLFLADAQTGEIIRKVASLVNDSDLDNFNYLESAGTFSPNGREFAFVAFRRGENVLVIKDAESGKTTETLTIPGVPAFSGPSWAPDGRHIVVTGLVDGQSDLFQFDLRTKLVTQLTNDKYSAIHASHSSDGSKLVFSYDKRSFDQGRTFGKYTMDLAIMDLVSNRITILDVFHGADNLNPMFDHEDNIYFYSDRDGFRNLYKYIPFSGEVLQMTDLLTGISGITRYSPAIAVSTRRDRVMYTHYYGGSYSIYQASSEQLLNRRIDPKSVSFDAGTLPFNNPEVTDIVNANLNNIDNVALVDPFMFSNVPYRPQFKLDYIGGGGGIGVSTGNVFRNYTGLQGGAQFLFSDILGDNQIFTVIAMNGEILDVGGQFAYLNRKNRLAWGLGLSHVPLRTGFVTFAEDNSSVVIDGRPITTLKQSFHILRIFDDALDIFAHYPFSTTLRLEGNLGPRYRSFRYDIYDDFYFFDPSSFTYRLTAQDRNKQEIGDEIMLNPFYTLRKGFGFNGNLALVGDNSYFGLTSPLAGQRFRIGLEYVTGTDQYYGAIMDFRRYIWKKPFSFAWRGMSYLRFEQTENSVWPIYVGDMGFVRGYGSIFNTRGVEEQGINFGQLIGTKMALTNFEIRIPFTGPRNLSLISTGFLFSDLAFFFDAGVAFNEFNHLRDGMPMLVPRRDEDGNIIIGPGGQPVLEEQFLKPFLATSAGVALRINLFGAMILEPYYAWPLHQNGRPSFGLNIIPGW